MVLRLPGGPPLRAGYGLQKHLAAIPKNHKTGIPKQLPNTPEMGGEVITGSRLRRVAAITPCTLMFTGLRTYTGGS